MNIDVELPRAIRSRNAKRVGEICDHLRFKRGMNYKAQTDLVIKLECSPADFEDLLYEADRLQ